MGFRVERNAALLWVAISVLAGHTGCGSGSRNQLQPVDVRLSPKRSAIAAGVQEQQFAASVNGDSSNSVKWSVDGIVGGSPTVGNITVYGAYSALSGAAGTHRVTATSIIDPTKSASATVAVSDLPGVLTYHNNRNRDGTNTQEYALGPSTVSSSTFGKLFSCPVDGAVYAQPLWVPGVSIGGVLRNVLYVATQHDSLFAFDADANPCVTLWQANLLDTLHGGASGEVPVVWSDVGYCSREIYPEVGVTGTPVIDPISGTIYLVSASEIPGPHSGICPLPAGGYYHRLHALDLTTGAEKLGAPVTIAASVAGTGDGSSGGLVSFSSQFAHQRSGLALAGDGTVYVAFASHEDATPFHGWLLGYRASDVQQQLSSFNTTPNGIGGADGGIWASGGAPAVDSQNDVYVSTGNGIFDQGSGFLMENDYGDSVLRLTPAPGVVTANGANLKLVDYFTPNTESCLAAADADLGSGAPVILPEQTTAGLPSHLLVQLGKDGVVYLVNGDNMGQFVTDDCLASSKQIVQSFPGTGGFWGTPAFWQNSLYFAGADDALKQFSFNLTTGQFNTTASSQSNQVYGFPDVSPSISSQGAANGIVWAIDNGLFGFGSPNAAGGVNCFMAPVPPQCTGPAILHAYNATNLANEYWNSSQAANNGDQAGNAVKFIPPTVANGKVYVGTRTEIDVYGLLPE
jgi:hypothetical protein